MDYEPLTGGQERAYAQLEQRRLLEINAALLAALEPLLSKFYSLCSGFGPGTSALYYDELQAARAAIAKAKGGQSSLSPEVTTANQRLFVAAPDLFEALEALTKNCIKIDVGNLSGLSGCTAMVRLEDLFSAVAAITKAKGDQ